MDPADKSVAARIRKLRTAQVALTVTDGRGRPLANTPVTIRQTKHKFLFGCNIFSLRPGDGSPEQRAYQRRFTDLLNFATLPFYWGRYEPEPGKTQVRKLKAMANWCLGRGLQRKGHPLCWHTVPVKWWRQFNLEEMLRRQMARITREVKGFAGLVDVWDVLNEAAIMPDFEYGENPLTPVAKDMGAVELIRRCFGRARRANPNATLLLNDYDHSAAFERIVERSLDAGAEIDAIGIQSHMHKGYLGDEHIWEICERFSRFGLPLHWTEATLISGRTYQNMSFHIPRKSWPSTPDGEARQAEEAASFYTTLFSHPAVEAITWWDLVDGHWLNAPSGLLRRDFSPKPAYDALMSLVKDRWWTAPQELSTDSHGRLRFRGFLGNYEARVAEQSGSFDLRETGDTQAEVLLSKP